MKITIYLQLTTSQFPSRQIYQFSELSEGTEDSWEGVSVKTNCAGRLFKGVDWNGEGEVGIGWTDGEGVGVWTSGEWEEANNRRLCRSCRARSEAEGSVRRSTVRSTNGEGVGVWTSGEWKEASKRRLCRSCRARSEAEGSVRRSTVKSTSSPPSSIHPS